MHKAITIFFQNSRDNLVSINDCRGAGRKNREARRKLLFFYACLNSPLFNSIDIFIFSLKFDHFIFIFLQSYLTRHQFILKKEKNHSQRRLEKKKTSRWIN